MHRFFFVVFTWRNAVSTLRQFLSERLRAEDAKRLDAPDQPPWLEEGVTAIVDEAVYMHHLEVLPLSLIHI